MLKTISELVRTKESEFTSGTKTHISKYVDYDLNDNNNRIDAYINSVHISGGIDSKGREKPFENIVIDKRNIWFWATDIDRKNIRIKGGKRKQKVQAFLANVLLQSWMRKSGFGSYLNEWGLALSTYGSSMVEFVEKDKELVCSVRPWNQLIVDNVDVDNDIKIKKLFFTPAQLRKNKAYDQEFVKKLIDSTESRKTLDKQNQDNKSDYIPVYEVHGEIERSYLTGDDKDDDEFVQQMHVVSFVKSKEKSDQYDEFTLYKGVEDKDPMMITHLIKEDGRATGIGAVEHAFEGQWMVNHAAYNIKNKLDMAAKEIQQTSDEAFVGKNITTDIDHGDILFHKDGAQLSPVQWNTSDIPSWQADKQNWKNTVRQIEGISEAMSGDNPPSGQAWRTVQAMLQESHSLFELMAENKGLEIEKMLRLYIIPYLKKKLDTSEEIGGLLDGQAIKELDMMYTPNEAARRYNDQAIKNILAGNIVSPYQKDIAEKQVRDEWTIHGGERFFKPSDIEDETWKDVLEGFEWDAEVEVTNEAKDKQAILASLDTLLQTLIKLNGRQMTPEEKLVLNKILEEVGVVSTIEMSQLNAQSNQAQPVPSPDGMSPIPGGSAGEVLPTNAM